ncbi:alpha/beta fold hydrolase [Altererythrobacter sp.]|uniref:alpha/beta fold hydrolase n=2 Tax=Altererythrobacter sp. TaxID=1872480 RepID=UPI003D0028C1
MATFVLIHGSWHGGWCFDEVRRLLEAEGHEVIAPDLPGMGGNEEELGAVTLEGWGNFTVEQCRKASQSPVVLAGHSRGGLVVTQAAESDPQAMDAIVYICAMMMPSGMSRAEFKAMEESNPAFDALIQPTAGGHGTVITGEHPERVFAQLSPAELVEPAMQRLVAEPHGPRSTRLYPTPERWGSLPRTYIECTEDRTIPISSQRRMQAMSPGAKVVTLDADHSPFLSRPRELADALIEAASR